MYVAISDRVNSHYSMLNKLIDSIKKSCKSKTVLPKFACDKYLPFMVCTIYQGGIFFFVLHNKNIDVYFVYNRANESATVSVLPEKKKKLEKPVVTVTMEPVVTQVQSKKKEKKNRKLMRTAGGHTWEDSTLGEWDDGIYTRFFLHFRNGRVVINQ